MDVKCERCSTEYEFDDALVSGRGTTVKCTNCGHKFKIRRQDGDYSEDFWNVLTKDGRTLVFTSLRELQRAIQTHLVDRHDTLSRGGLPPKPIGTIPELAPFFDQREEPARRSLVPPNETPPIKSSRPPPPPGAPGPALAAPPRARQATKPDFPPAPGGIASVTKTLAGTGPDDPVAPQQPSSQSATPAAPPMRARMSSVPPPDVAPKARSVPPPLPTRASEPPPKTQPIPVIAHAEPAPVVDVPREEPAPAPPFEASSPLPPVASAAARKMLISEYDEMRAHSPSLPDAPSSMGRRRSVGGFVVVTVLLLGVGILGAVWARDHLGQTLGTPKPGPSASVTDPRVADLLAAGEKALADGNLDVARESFDKASVLADKDARVLVATARLSAMRADVPWLKLRLLPSSAADEQRLAKDTLAELSAKAKKDADAALAVAPDDVAALRAKIDALRLAGDREGARGLVAKVTASASAPESAYVLAALDLAEAQPLWSTVIERLRVAAGAETGPGRARAALVYALARSGDAAGAKAELDRLEAMPRRGEVFPVLRAFVERQPASAVDAGAPASPDAGLVAAAGSGKPTSGGGGGPLPADPRVLVARGEEARAKGDYERAAQMFNAALEKNSGDTEALSGLAAVAYARRDLAGAKASYKRVLSINPSYVPALVGAADCDWDSGDRAGAMKTYKEIVERFPEGTYPGRVKQRSEAAPPPPAPAPAPPPAPAPTPTSTEAQ